MSHNRGFSLKDQLFNLQKVRYLAGLFGDSDAGFDAQTFETRVMSRLLELELKERINWIAEVLEQMLPDDYTAAAAMITKALPAPLDPELSDDDFGDFIFAPLGEFVARNGMAVGDLPVSYALLAELTKRFTVEYAIRHFLNAHPERTMAELALWAGSENYHIRRLVSEGTRPSLPWGVKIGLEADAGLPLLEMLHSDKTRFVTRSVANHLNDIAKKQPDLVVATLTGWRDMGKQNPKEMRWMTSHALRVLVKQGHQGALELLGFRAAPKVSLGVITLTPKNGQVVIGAQLGFSCAITAARDERLMVDFIIDFVKKDGSRKPKVFKLKQLQIGRGETVVLTKKHRFLGNATTFRVFAGRQKLSLQVNGNAMGAVEFDLVAP